MVKAALIQQENTLLKLPKSTSNDSKEFALTGENLDDKRIKKLANMLKTNNDFVSVNLSNNNIHTKGFKKLADAVSESHSLIEINFSNNQIGDSLDSIRALKGITAEIGGVFLKQFTSTSLEKLDLSNNPLGDGGAIAIAKALKKNSTLRCLNLMNTEIGNRGARKILNVLRKNRMSALNNLNLDGNNEIAAELLKDINQMLSRRSDRSSVAGNRYSIFHIDEEKISSSLNLQNSLSNTHQQNSIIDAKICSLVSSGLSVTPRQWVVSILRKPKGRNPDHAFLVLEGVSQFSKGLLSRFDLVNNDEKPGYAKIDEISFNNLDLDVETMKNIYRKDIVMYSDVYAKSWNITHAKALDLIEDIRKDVIKGVRYNVCGGQSLPAKSTSNDDAYNCYTWARTKLYNLNDPRIELSERWTDWIAAKTSFHIVSLNEPEQKPSCSIM